MADRDDDCTALMEADQREEALIYAQRALDSAPLNRREEIAQFLITSAAPLPNNTESKQ